MTKKTDAIKAAASSASRGGMALGVCALSILAADIRAESLYNPATFHSFVADHKAAVVGDSVTLLIIEYSEASSEADNAGNRGIGASVGLSKTNRNEFGNLDLDFNEEGGRATTRAGNLRAQITAVVEQVDNNGRMLVAGHQQIIVNGEKQDITLKGWIRPYDISSTNTVLSTRLSDASIEYRGQNADQLKTGGGIVRKIGDLIVWVPNKALDLTSWLLGVL